MLSILFLDMIESERESRAQNDESVQFVTSTPTQRTNSKNSFFIG